MTTRKSNDYKITAVNYYLVEDKTQEEVCKIKEVRLVSNRIKITNFILYENYLKT